MIDGRQIVADRLLMENKLARQVLSPGELQALEERARLPGKCLSKGMRNRRIINVQFLKDGSRVELHATKGFRRYAHG